MTEPSAHTRARPCKELGERFAALLAEPHSHQLGVCGRLRIPYSTFKRWMAAESEEGGEHAEFQGLVLEALDKARVRDIEALDRAFDVLDGPQVAKAGALVSKHTFHHQNRFKRFYQNDEEPKQQQVALSGEVGTKHSGEIGTGRGMSKSVARLLAMKVLGVPAAMLGEEPPREPEPSDE